MSSFPDVNERAVLARAISIRDDIALEAIAPAAWDRLTDSDPLLSHAFLTALHGTGCASPATGWTPRYLTAWRDGELVGALPLYAKSHSYGEYIFDWAWADAYHRHGRRYYPKLVAAIPFTPAPGTRMLAVEASVRVALLDHALAGIAGPRASSQHAPCSSLHLLFLPAEEAAIAAAAGMTIRHGVQFHWENANHRDFGDYLAAFNHEKRKKVRQDRRGVAAAGVTFQRKVGEEITPADWEFFHQCYTLTYRAHRSTPYLSRDCFTRVGATMPANLLMVIGSREGARVCAALDVFSATTMRGRYWGRTQPIPGLHFEACYYQAIEFCIERGIARFEGGAQGVHKMARGLMPVATWSAHAIADPDFAAAIADFCAQERIDVAHAVDELESRSPFRNGAAGDPD